MSDKELEETYGYYNLGAGWWPSSRTPGSYIWLFSKVESY